MKKGIKTMEKDSIGSYEAIQDSETSSLLQEEFEIAETKHSDSTHLLTPYQTTKGLTVFTGAVFLAGELAGTGVLTLPSAMSRTGYYGIPIMFLTAVLSTYCGILLGKSWNVAKMTRETDDYMQDPYPYIGEVACGKHGRNAVTVLLSLNIVLICLVFLTLTSQIISGLLTFHIQAIPVKEEFRVWLLICTLIILPFTWLGTPKDFWGVGLAALGATLIGAILILAKLGIISVAAPKAAVHGEISIVSFFSGFATLIFAFTGISLFPTVQTDMKEPDRFPAAVILGYCIVLVTYVPVAVFGFLVFGKDVKSSILVNLSWYDSAHGTRRVLVSITDILFATHLIFAFVMYINPFVQQLEGFFKINNEFSWRRCVLRSGVVLAILGLAEIFPRFGPVIDLVGGFLNTILCFIFPIIFYYRLHHPISLWHKCIMLSALIISVCALIFSTYSAIENIRKALQEIYS